jgi:CO/xanthine dehydrogenase FAD-binding subunit
VRSHLADFDVASPRTLAEALDLMAEGAANPGSVTPLAGATDLFVLMNAGHLPATRFISLHAVPEFAAPARWEDDRYTVSALTTYSESRHDAQVAARLPLLVAAARELGALQIQNRGTWAGNIANASPAADGVPALLAYDAVVELASVRGRRWVALADYFTGYKQSLRAPDELITAVTAQVPAAGARHYWRKVGTRKLQAISKVVAAGVLELGAAGVVTRARLALGSVAPIPLRARHVEAAVMGLAPPAATDAALAALARDIAPIDDVRSTRDYRMRIARNLVRAFLAP